MDYQSEESFPLSSFDFNSSFGLYSSDEDDDCYIGQQLDTNYSKDDDDDDDDDEAFIEYELYQPETAAATPPPTVPAQVEDTSVDHHQDDEELEFRISFSTFIPFPGFFPAPVIDPTNIFSFSASLFKTWDMDANINSHSSETVDHGNDKDNNDDCRINNWELVPNRKASSLSSKIDSKKNGGIMNILVKLRCVLINIGSIRTAGNNQRRLGCKNMLRSWNIANLMKPFENCCTNRRKDDLKKLVMIRRSKGRERSPMSSPSKVVALEELKRDVLRKLFVTESFSTSIKSSSPVHQSADAADAGAVRAAIAHCKKSLGQTDEFCF